MSLSLAPRPRPVGVPAGRERSDALRIAIPRPAALLTAVFVFGFCAATLALTGLGAPADAALYPLCLPLLVVAASAGVERLAAWLPQAFGEWRGPLGYLTAAPWAGLALVTLALPDLALPAWVPPAAGALAAVPFLWSAVGPRRLRAWLRPEPDAYGRRGALAAALALALLMLSVLQPWMAPFLWVALTVGLALAALLPRGLADAGATWRGRTWAGLAWGVLLVWAAQVVALPGMSAPPAQLGLLVGAALPMALTEVGGRPR